MFTWCWVNDRNWKGSFGSLMLLLLLILFVFVFMFVVEKDEVCATRRNRPSACLPVMGSFSWEGITYNL